MAAAYGIYDILGRTAGSSACRHRSAVSFGGDTRDFAAVRDRVLRLSNGLVDSGMAPGDRVAVLMGNSHEWIESMFAITLAGGVCVPVNVLLRGSEVDHVLGDSGATMLIADKLAEPALAEIAGTPEKLILVGDAATPEGRARLEYEQVLGRGQARLPDRNIGALDPAMIYYTSGTTGRAKGALHAHSGVLWNTYHQIAEAQLTPDDVYLLVPSLSWAAGFHDITLALWWIGGRVAVVPSGGMTIEKIVAAVEREGATGTMLVPTLLKQLVSDPDRLERLRRSRLRRIYTGAEPVPQAIVDAAHAALPDVRIVQLYGFSEFPLMTAVLGAHESAQFADRTGRPTSIVSIAVRTDEGEITDRGVGEILVRSPATMLGYHNRPEANVEAFRDGWFNTGDAGRLDDEGFLTLTGRTKDLIISGGMNVYPREIEEVIHRLDGIGEVAVVGVPDDKWGERVVAIVVMQDGADGAEAEVERACAAQLSSYKRPREIIVRQEALPRTPTGKILKRELRPWVQATINAGASR